MERKTTSKVVKKFLKVELLERRIVPFVATGLIQNSPGPTGR